MSPHTLVGVAFLILALLITSSVAIFIRGCGKRCPSCIRIARLKILIIPECPLEK